MKNKYDDLKRKVFFTLGVLIVYRIGTYVPIPGVNVAILKGFISKNMGGALGMFDMFSGGALSRMTVFALNLMPYISAGIITQLMTVVMPSLENLKKEGELGRKKLAVYTRYLTVFIAVIQAYGVSSMILGLEDNGTRGVYIPDQIFVLIAVLTLVSGTLFLMWLGEQISARGIGNGSSLIIFSGIVANLPSSFLSTFELGRSGSLSISILLFVLFCIVFVIFFVVFFERAQRKIVIQYPKSSFGPRHASMATQHLPLKVNNAGVIPPIFASSLLMIPVTFLGLNKGYGSSWMADIGLYFHHGHPVYMVFYASLIVFFSFFYTSVVFNPTETAENLRKHGGFVSGIRPGAQTSEYFNYVLTRLTCLGSVYLLFLCLLPEFLISKFSIPFYFGGTSILIVVSVTIDTATQVRSFVMTNQYGHLVKKTKKRTRFRRSV